MTNSNLSVNNCYGRQELNAELLDDVPGALWNRALLEAARPPIGFVLPDLVRVVAVVAVAALCVTRTSGQEMPNLAAWERDSPPPEPKRTVLSPSCQWPIAKETPPKGLALGAFL